MSYQPPPIGSKKLLNFTAHSYPGAGALLALLALAAGVAAVSNRPPRGPMVAAVLFGATACTGDSRPIAYGRDVCERCHMGVSDPRFGVELVTTRGKVLVFDSVECLVAHVGSLTDPPNAGS